MLIQSSVGSYISYRGKTHENITSNEHYITGSVCSQRFSCTLGTNGILYRPDSQCSSLYASHPVTSIEFLVSSKTVITNRNPMYSTPGKSFQMVETESKHFQGSLSTTETNGGMHHNRCIKNNVWRAFGQSVCTRVMVRESEKLAHKHVGIGSSSAYCKTFSSSVSKQISVDQVGQHHSCSNYQQSGLHKIKSTLYQSLGSLESGNSTQYGIKSSPYLWQNEHFSRSIESQENQGNRMDIKQRTCAEDFFHLWGSTNGSICISSKSSDANFLHMVSEQISLCSRCSINFVGEHVCLRLSPTLSDSKSPETFFAVPLHNYSNCTTVATETLVHRDAPVSDCLPSETPSGSQSSQSAANANLPSST